MRLIFGARSPVQLPWGDFPSVLPYSVLEFMRLLESEKGGLMSEYEHLCEACHPNSIQNSYFFMMGKTGDNWNNEGFKSHANILLEQLLEISEKIVVGIADDTEELLSIASEYVRGMA